MRSFESYIQEQELAMIGVELDKVAEVLRQQPNKNQGCWIYSFGWKDADLDPEGCTGIESFIPVDDETFNVVIGGHKTVCPPDDESLNEDAQMLVCGCGYAGEWTGDDWSLSFEDQVSVPWVFTADGNDIDYKATARAAKEAARKACEPFSREMKYIEEALAEPEQPEDQEVFAHAS